MTVSTTSVPIITAHLSAMATIRSCRRSGESCLYSLVSTLCITFCEGGRTKKRMFPVRHRQASPPSMILVPQ